LTIGALFAVAFIIGQLNGPVTQLINSFLQWQYAKLSLTRLNEIHSQQSELNITGREEVDIFHRSIVIENVFFTYQSKRPDSYILKNINLVIPAGQTTAIVGESGSGKTTILKLLLKLYSEFDGEISLNGIDIREIPNQQWRKLCGAVLQDSFIFSDTIAYNICLNRDFDKNKLFSAIKLANLEDFVSSLIQKEKTKIGENGWAISAGQKQRILIARVIYKNPDYIFFDEATNSLDAHNELVIMNNLNYFTKNKTVVIVAHRLSTVKNANKIIVVEKGQITEQGSHDYLISQKGKYYNLVRNQLELDN